MTEGQLIVCESLTRVYGEGSRDYQALKGVSFSIRKGEFVAIMGPSGCGKSTLLNVLGGLDRPTGGRALVGKQDLGRLSPSALDEYRRKKVGFVWQQGSRNLIPYLTAVENIELPLTLSGIVGTAARGRATELLKLVELQERAGHRLEELSGGEQQRVAIARAIAKQPAVLLCDEPTGALDISTGVLVLEALAQINAELGTTTVVITHNAAIAAMADRVIRLADGRVTALEERTEKLLPRELSW